MIFAAGAYFTVTKSTFLYKFEDFFPRGDEELVFYEWFKKQVEPDDNLFIIAVRNERGVYHQSFLRELNRLTNEADSIENVVSSHSITNFKYVVATPFGAFRVPALHLDDAARYKEDSADLSNDPMLAGRFVSADAKTVGVLLKTKNNMDSDENRRLVENINELLLDFKFDEVHQTGRASIQTRFIDKTEQELKFYTLLASMLVIGILFFIFRKWLGVFISFLSVITGLVLFLGLLALFHVPLGIMSTLFPTLMMIIGMSDVMHIMTKYLDETERGNNNLQAMRTTWKEIGYATFLTAINTAIGFASLFTSSVVPVREFGIQAACGVMLAYIVTMLFTCAMLVLVNPKNLRKASTSSNHLIEKGLRRIHQIVKNNRSRIIVITSVVILICGYFMTQINRNVKILDDIGSSDPIIRDMEYVADHLIGERPYELAILAQDVHTVDELPVLKEIEKLESHLAAGKEFSNIVSPTLIYKSLNRANNGGSRDAYLLPADENDFARQKKLLRYASESEMNILLSADKKTGRLTARTEDEGSEEMKKINLELMQWVSENIDTSIVQFKPTGTTLLIEKSNDYLSHGVFLSLFIEFAFVGFMLTISFGSFRLFVVSIIPNVIPLIITAGIMGMAGIEFKASTSIIFTIAFGIAIDDTLHFLSRYKIERKKGTSVADSVEKTFEETGKAIIYTTLILLSGFFILCFSSFRGTYYIGLLVSITLFSAMIIELFVTPLLIYLFYSKEPKLKEKLKKLLKRK